MKKDSKSWEQYTKEAEEKYSVIGVPLTEDEIEDEANRISGMFMVTEYWQSPIAIFLPGCAAILAVLLMLAAGEAGLNIALIGWTISLVAIAIAVASRIQKARAEEQVKRRLAELSVMHRILMDEASIN